MEDQEELILVGENGEIPAGLPGNIMRKSIENKNLLKQKDSIYIGTGEKDEDGVAITEPLKGENNTVFGVNNNEKVGFYKINHNMVTASTVNTYGDVSNEYFITCSKIKIFPYNGYIGMLPRVSTADSVSCAYGVKYISSGESVSLIYELESIYSKLTIQNNRLKALEDSLNE